MKYMRLVFAVFLLMVFVGCASGGVMIDTVPSKVKLSSYSSLWVSIASETASAEEMDMLADMVVQKLRSSNTFKELSGPGENSAPLDLQLKLFIVDIRRVSLEDRATAGALPGKAKVLVDGELIDTASGGQIGSFRVEGKSSGGSVFAGDTQQAIIRASEMIVDYILDNY
jgi:hypothetical protein